MLKLNEILLIAYLCITLAVFLPIIIYGFVHLHRNWNQMYFVKRKRSIMLCLIVVFSYCVLIGMPLACTVEVFAATSESSFSDLMLYVNLFAPLTFMYWLWSLRVYALYYDHRYAQVLRNKPWIEVINIDVIHNNWILQHRHSLGSAAWLLKRTVFIPFLSAAAAIVLFELNRSYAMFWLLLLLIISIAFCAVIHSKYPKQRDHFGIQNEMIVAVKTLVVELLIFCGAIAIGKYVLPDEFWRLLLLSTLSACWTVLLCILFFSHIHYYQTSGQQRNDISQTDNIMEHFIQHQTGYEAFMKFVSLEFSMENLLFITEYAHILDVLYAVYGTKMQAAEKLHGFVRIQLPKNMVRSKIAETLQQNLTDVKKTSEEPESAHIDYLLSAFRELYCRYIESATAPFGINLCYQKRAPLQKIYDCNTANTIQAMIEMNTAENVINFLVPLYDKCAIEIKFLLQESFTRFEYSDVYDEK